MTAIALPILEAERSVARRLPIGAEVTEAGVHFRVWAPKRRSVSVVFDGDAAPPLPLGRERSGHFSGLSEAARAGHRYSLKLDDEGFLYPDPASRYQPEGPHGPSQVVDPRGYEWEDRDWAGVGPAGLVIYEMHVGTFTREGTWAAAAGELPELAALGVNCIEVMPVNDFAGRFGWGYDGVDLFAPCRLYGAPDDMRRFVDAAHANGIAVILDVVYNHLGPDGNYLGAFTDTFFSRKHPGEWGDLINYDDRGSEGVREFFVANARYWVDEFHLDGYRFDATQAILDDSPTHVLAEIARAARAAAAPRRIYLVSENEPQDTRIVRPRDRGGHGMDALWNDDFHHSALVVLTGHNEAYFSDHAGSPQEFVSAAKYGYLFQGQFYHWQKKRRGTPALDLPPTAFVNFIENHDQVANLARGLRTHALTSPGHYRAMVGLLLLSPQTPMLFQGQEFAASAPFQYFADHKPELARLVREGRGKFMCQFPSVDTPGMRAVLPDPGDPATFERCKLDLSERGKPGHAEVYALYKALLRLRRTDPLLSRVPERGELDGAVLGPEAFCLRWFDPAGRGNDRLLLVNFGIDGRLRIAPEPLLAPPRGRRWEVLWSSEAPEYGGNGVPPIENASESFSLPGRATILLHPAAVEGGGGRAVERPVPNGA